MTPITYDDYRKARDNETQGGSGLPIPATSAARLARFEASPPDWHGLEPTGNVPGEGTLARGAIGGFTIEVQMESGDFDMGGDWIGTFTPAHDRYGDRIPKPDPSAILWNNNGYWRLERGEHWYTPTESLDELADYYHKQGASHSVAREYALADIKRRADQDAQVLEDGEYLVTVTASRAGIELGSGSLGGFAVGKNWEHDLTGSGYLEDMIEQAIIEARDTLARLTA